MKNIFAGVLMLLFVVASLYAMDLKKIESIVKQTPDELWTKNHTATLYNWQYNIGKFVQEAQEGGRTDDAKKGCEAYDRIKETLEKHLFG